MGRPPDAERREVLLQEVSRYILREGLAELSLRPLAKELETSPRMLLYHFGSKEQLISEALRQLRIWQQDAATEWAEEDGPLDLPTLLRSGWAWWTSEETRPFLRLFFEVYGLALQDPDRYPRFLAHVVDDWLPLIERLLWRAGAGKATARREATLLLAAQRGLLLDLLATGDQSRVNRAHEELVAELEERLGGGR